MTNNITYIDVTKRLLLLAVANLLNILHVRHRTKFHIALPWILNNIHAKCEVNKMNSSQQTFHSESLEIRTVHKDRRAG